MRGIIAAVAVLWLTSTAAVGAQEIEAGPLTLDLTGRAQVQFSTTSIDEDDVGPADPATAAFETRRIRLGTTFEYEEWITGKIETELAGGGARLTDGYVDFGFSDAFAVRAGQFKKPFGLIELTSSTQTPTIERGLRLRGIEDLVAVPGETQFLLDGSRYVGRQIGVMAHGRVGPVLYQAGVFNGEGANVTETEATKAYAARLRYGVLPSLFVGGGASVQPTGAFDADGEEITGTAFMAEAAYGGFRTDGLRLLAELMLGDNALSITGDEPASMVGAHLVAAWFVPRTGRVEAVEPAFRLSWADPDTDVDGDAGLLVTPGLNLYFTGRNRLMLNGEVYLPAQDGLDPEFGLVSQIQVYF